jgi:signal transduction histidine kinase
MAGKTFQRMLLALVLLTLLALYAHANWMVRTLRLDTMQGSEAAAVDDRSEGGKSVSALLRQGEGLRLQCDIAPAYQWPFCELDLRFSKDDQGIDLSRFDTLRLSIRATGPTSGSGSESEIKTDSQPRHFVRVFLRNFDPAYSKPGNGASLKPHEVVFEPAAHAMPVELKLSQFMVSSWWMQEHHTSIEMLGPQLEHVTALAIATADNAAPGRHEIVLESAELRGLWISSATFRLGIIFVWLVCMVAYLVIYLVGEWQNSREKLSESDRHLYDLHNSNELLERRVEERTRALSSSNSRLIETLQNLDVVRKELVQSEKNAALGTLVAGISHELNTPIGNAVLVGSALGDSARQFRDLANTGLTRKALDAFLLEVMQGSDILNQNLSRAAALIASFKQLAADQHSGQRRIFSLVDVMNETALAMAPRLRKTLHQLEIEVPPDLVMDSYPGPLSQIIMNFMNNAMLHGFEGVQHGKMCLQAKLVGADRLEISFSDNGVGISAQVLRRVFEPFFTTKLGKGGSGLGMHLVYNIVTQLFGGQIEISSTLGQGTRIRIEMPLLAPTASAECARIGVPTDVVDDYNRFLDGRDVQDISYFGGAFSRRDVVELALFMREMHRHMPDVEIDLVAIDSYALAIEHLRSGQISALATSSWLLDLQSYKGEIEISGPIVQDGQFIVGAYTRASNDKALGMASLTDFRALRVVSNSDWSADWQTLAGLGVSDCVDVKTWRQMVYMVNSDEADILLAPFPSNSDCNIEFEACILIPVPDCRIVLNGSRHLAAARSKVGLLIVQNIFPAFDRMVDDGSMRQAFSECGFLNTATEHWHIINGAALESMHGT